MTELYNRLLIWHKLICQQTGGLALCSAKRKLNRDEARGWIEAFRNVADDIQAVLDGTPRIIDDRGRRVVESGTGEKPEPRFFGISGGADEVAQHVSHVNPKLGVDGATGKDEKASGPRPARRKQ